MEVMFFSSLLSQNKSHKGDTSEPIRSKATIKNKLLEGDTQRKAAATSGNQMILAKLPQHARIITKNKILLFTITFRFFLYNVPHVGKFFQNNFSFTSIHTSQR
jgi:hypothetical protein